MDQEATNIVAIASAVGGVALAVIGYINHHRLRSNCCGKRLEVSIDISPTSPKKAADPPMTIENGIL